MTCKELTEVWKDLAAIYHQERRSGSDRPDVTLDGCISRHGRDAVAETLATVVRLKDYDGRISPENRRWAAGIACNPVAISRTDRNSFLYAGLDEIHMAHLDQLVSAIR